MLPSHFVNGEATRNAAAQEGPEQAEPSKEVHRPVEIFRKEADGQNDEWE
jgi:hypothetical protein